MPLKALFDAMFSKGAKSIDDILESDDDAKLQAALVEAISNIMMDDTMESGDKTKAVYETCKQYMGRIDELKGYKPDQEEEGKADGEPEPAPAPVEPEAPIADPEKEELKSKLAAAEAALAAETEKKSLDELNAKVKALAEKIPALDADVVKAALTNQKTANGNAALDEILDHCATLISTGNLFGKSGVVGDSASQEPEHIVETMVAETMTKSKCGRSEAVYLLSRDPVFAKAYEKTQQKKGN